MDSPNHPPKSVQNTMGIFGQQHRLLISQVCLQLRDPAPLILLNGSKVRELRNSSFII